MLVEFYWTTAPSDGVGYEDLGTDYFSRLDASKTIQRLLTRLADLGYHPPSTSPS